MGKYSGLIEQIFQVGSGEFSLWTQVQNQVIYLDQATGGLFIGLCILLPVVLVYQKTNSVAQQYGLIVVTLNVIRLTIFSGQGTILFYLLIMIISQAFFKAYKKAGQ